MKNTLKVNLISNVNFLYLEEYFQKYSKKKNLKFGLTKKNFEEINLIKNKSEILLIYLDPLSLLQGIEYKYSILSKKDRQRSKIYLENFIKKINSFSKSFQHVYFLNSFNYRFSKSLDEFINLNNEILLKLHKEKNHLIDIKKFYLNYGVKNILNERTIKNFNVLFNKKHEKLFAKFIIDNLNQDLNPIKKKIIVFDCDNTLWRGIIGESKLSEIEYDEKTNNGKLFCEVHYRIKNLLKKGTMIALCSKNNLKDVKKVFDQKKSILNFEDFTAVKINWKNKPENLKELSKELNIGLESFIFIDDSKFEISLVKKTLPQIECHLVPDELWKYPSLVEEIERKYFSKTITKEDLLRNQSYLIEKKRKNERFKFKDFNKFVDSLKIEIFAEENNIKNINRISQMTLRTNQFNFTTKRYNENQIKKIINNKNFITLTFDIKDRFGDYGITALVIMKINKDKKKLEIDTFLMSCRVLGKNIHKKILDYLILTMKKRKFKEIELIYIETEKNIILKDIINEFDIKKKNQSKTKKSLSNWVI